MQKRKFWILLTFLCLLNLNSTFGAVTSGSVTIKLSGGTYSTWAAFWDDLGNLTGNLTCTVDASAFTENSAPGTVSETLGGYTLHVLPASFPTKTDASDGARFTCNYIGPIIVLGMEGAGTVIIEGMVLIEGTSEPENSFILEGVTTTYSLTIRRNIVKGCATSVFMNDSTVTDYQIYNNIIIDASSYNIRIDDAAATAVVANNTLVGSANDNVKSNNIQVDYENNLNYGASDLCWLQIATATNGYNNASSDTTGEDADWGGTGSNNLDSIADPFNNLAADDFTITAAGVIGSAGLDLSSDFTTDFFGTTRSNWTIGACEYVSVGAGGQVIFVNMN